MSAKSTAQGPTYGSATWSQKSITTWAIAIALIFAAIVIVFPMMYNPVDRNTPATEPMLPPSAVPVVPAQPAAPGN